MARNDRYEERDEERAPKFSNLHATIEGNLTREPEESKGGAVFINVGVNTRDYRGEEGAIFVSASLFGSFADWAMSELRKGDRVFLTGPVYISEWETSDGEKRTSYTMEPTHIGPLPRFYGKGGPSRSTRTSRDNRGGGRSSSRSRDDDYLEESEEEEVRRPTRVRRPAPARDGVGEEDGSPVRRGVRRTGSRRIGDSD